MNPNRTFYKIPDQYASKVSKSSKKCEKLSQPRGAKEM